MASEAEHGDEYQDVPVEPTENENKQPPEGEQAPGGSTRVPQPLEELGALQLDMEPLNARASRAFARLKSKLGQRRKSHLDRRSTLIQAIPGFWAQAFVNHPQLSSVISEQDEDMLSYMIKLEVEESRHPNHGCKIMFFFRLNPYFWNRVIIKEYLLSTTGYRASHSTPIQWYQDYMQEALTRRHHDSSINFFNWFSEHNFAESNWIVKIITEDLWRNPLPYYMTGNHGDRALRVLSAGSDTAPDVTLEQ
ncbi:testis-specific Y-encoded protein 3-like [Tupaia chinensis]|uniref:testis-specific Y-encoded protein 3-like n=1 Tax=Tupaia chinensis TaxID=246437 RepID=UPI0003C91CE8|nr:testis-specific Y-encoded protein 3-like [Tupaia chinensis]